MERAKPGEGVTAAAAGGGLGAADGQSASGGPGASRALIAGSARLGKTSILTELNHGQDQGRDSNASENNKVQVLKVGHGIPSTKLGRQHGTVVMSVGP